MISLIVVRAIRRLLVKKYVRFVMDQVPAKSVTEKGGLPVLEIILPAPIVMTIPAGLMTMGNPMAMEDALPAMERDSND